MEIKNFYQMVSDEFIYKIAEIGINHNVSIKIAKRLIENVIETVWHAIKF